MAVYKHKIIFILILFFFVENALVYCELSEIDLSVAPKINAKDVLTQEDAVVLSAVYDIELKKNWKVTYKYTKRMKLFTEKACQMFGEVHVLYLKKLQTVPLFTGYTITPSGKKLIAKKITDYMPQKEMPIYEDEVVKVLSMPGLSKGCEIEYTYKIESDDLGFLGLFNDFHMFSETVPVEEARLSVKVSSETTLYYTANGSIDKPEIEEKNYYKTYIWQAKKVPPIKLEESMPPIRLLTSWVFVSTSDSWEDYIRGWRKIYDMRSALSPEIKEKAAEFARGAENEYEKAKSIYAYIQNSIRYLGIEFGRAGWIPYSAARVFTSKAGDCKGKTVLTIAMLKAVGIKAYPVMLTARANGPIIKDFCTEAQFSHIIAVCEIDGELIWMDTTSNAAFGTLPSVIQGVDALIVKKDGGFHTTPLSDANDNKLQMNANVRYAPDGIAEGTINLIGSGVNFTLYSNLMETMTTELKEQFVHTLFNSWVPGALIKTYNYSDYQDPDSTMKIELEFSSARQAEKVNDMLIVSPIFKKGPRTEFVKNERFYDIYLETKECSIKKEVIIKPVGFEFDTVPKDYTKRTPYFAAYIHNRLNGDVLTREICFEWLTTIIPKEEYQEFKKNLDEFDLWTDKKIILRKI